MNLENLVLQYLNTGEDKSKVEPYSEEHTRAVKKYSNDLSELFENMNYNYLLLKTNGIKTGAWNFADVSAELLMKLLKEFDEKESYLNKIKSGKYKDVPLKYLCELVDLCLDVLIQRGVSKKYVTTIKRNMYQFIELPIQEVRQEISKLSQVIEFSYDNDEDDLSMEYHMKLQEYAVKEIQNVRRKIAILYNSLNSDVSFIGLYREVKELQNDPEFVAEVEQIKEVMKRLSLEFTAQERFDKNMQEKITIRKKEIEEELFGHEKKTEYKEYIMQGSKLLNTCAEDKEYREICEKIDKVLVKNIKIKTKAKQVADLQYKLYLREKELLKDKLREKRIDKPEGWKEVEIPEQFQMNFDKSVQLVEEVASYPDEKEKEIMLYIMAKQKFGERF